MKNKETVNITNITMDTTIVKEKIFMIRGKKVMFDSDLAILYEVGTKRLNEAVKRNIKRFPGDFMFKLNKEESDMFLRSQFATSSWVEVVGKPSRSQFATLNRGDNIKHIPHVFTEQGIAMLSSVLKSDKAIEVNIQIIRIFTKLREMMDTYKDLREKVEEMEKSNKANFKEIFDVIKFLIREKVMGENKTKNPIGFTDKGN
jgi:uncharacterized protein (UPF0147 family)